MRKAATTAQSDKQKKPFFTQTNMKMLSEKLLATLAWQWHDNALFGMFFSLHYSCYEAGQLIGFPQANPQPLLLLRSCPLALCIPFPCFWDSSGFIQHHSASLCDPLILPCSVRGPQEQLVAGRADTERWLRDFNLKGCR